MARNNSYSIQIVTLFKVIMTQIIPLWMGGWLDHSRMNLISDPGLGLVEQIAELGIIKS